MQHIDLINTFFVQSPLTVLEVGPGHGNYSNALVDLGHFVTAVEAREDAEIWNRAKINSSVELVKKDIFKYLPSTRKWDVAVALGLIWRTHSPYYVLDLLMNQADHIMVDNPTKLLGSLYDQKYSISGVSLRLPAYQIDKYIQFKGWTKGWAKTAIAHIGDQEVWTAYYYKNGATPLASALDN